MENIRKINKHLCSKCQYRTKIGSQLACNYLAITGQSRIYQDREAAYDPKFCDKFKEGNQIIPRVDAVFLPSTSDIYDDYKYVKIRREKSRYEYKYYEKRMERNGRGYM